MLLGVGHRGDAGVHDVVSQGDDRFELGHHANLCKHPFEHRLERDVAVAPTWPLPERTIHEVNPAGAGVGVIQVLQRNEGEDQLALQWQAFGFGLG